MVVLFHHEPKQPRPVVPQNMNLQVLDESQEEVLVTWKIQQVHYHQLEIAKLEEDSLMTLMKLWLLLICHMFEDWQDQTNLLSQFSHTHREAIQRCNQREMKHRHLRAFITVSHVIHGLLHRTHLPLFLLAPKTHLRQNQDLQGRLL